MDELTRFRVGNKINGHSTSVSALTLAISTTV